MTYNIVYLFDRSYCIFFFVRAKNFVVPIFFLEYRKQKIGT